ncbi:hypothetical protein ACN27G_22550 [Plantactinospora sp. WMMB334]|uniref:hypothetical protein n=1 Tax=Plantactinospora sp. WMMB334 TaxID=3404119 RepID=UPI003B930C2B
MARNLLRALLYAWDQPAFRAGLQHLIDLDEVTTLLAALAVDDHDKQVELRAMQLVRSALDTAEIRHAVLLLIEDDDIRRSVAASITESMPDRPGLAGAIRSALEDPAVRAEFGAALESGALRAVVWKAAENQLRDHRWALARQVTILFVRHRHARRLAWALRRHGLVRELRHKPAAGSVDRG